MMTRTAILFGILTLAACTTGKLDAKNDPAWQREIERSHNAAFDAASPRGMVNTPYTSCTNPGGMNC